MSFAEYVAFYSLTRSEGALLRYLSDAYRALRSGVPDHARSEALDDIVVWLGETVRQTDSSLLDEWEQLVSARPDDATVTAPVRPGPATFTSNVRAFTVGVRNALFRRTELAALHRNLDLGELDGHSGWDADRWRAAIDAYFDEYDRLGTGADARNPALLHIDTEPADAAEDGRRFWRVRQVFDDPDGDRDWGITAIVDLDASDEAGEPVIRVEDVGPFAA